jgi:DNA modification methylase
MLKKALAKFGSLDGIIYNKKTKRLVCGHQRVGIFDPSTPVKITKQFDKPTKTGTVCVGTISVGTDLYPYREVWWDEKIEKAANIAANKGAGEWDKEQLGEWLQELSSFDANFDTDLTMFDTDELAEFEGITVKEYTRTGATGVDEDEVPEKAPPRTKLGDIYHLGAHRLLCGDSTDSVQVEKLMKGEKADMVFTDPPYGINLETDYIKRAGGGRKFDKIKNDETVFDASYLITLFKDIKEVFLWGAHNYCHTIDRYWLGSWVVWEKKNETSDTTNQGAFEWCWSKVRHRSQIARVRWLACDNDKVDKQTTRYHPTQKPVALAEYFFKEWGKDTQLVLDLFGGSGSTLIACEKTNRKCFMMEIDPHYCDVIVERWEKYTGQKAQLVAKPKSQTKKKLAAHAKVQANG